jgi:uncharacterized membrane protein (DUF441 family)
LNEQWLLLAILIVALAGKAKSVAIAACIILGIELIAADGGTFLKNSAPTLGTLGLSLLLVQTLSPLVTQTAGTAAVLRSLASPLALVAFGLSMVTTYLSGRGLLYMNAPQKAAEFIPLLLGGVVSAALFKGMPVGPYITAGILSVIGTWLVRFGR